MCEPASDGRDRPAKRLAYPKLQQSARRDLGGSTYIARTEFALSDPQHSTLVLNEHGYMCAPGLNANGYFKEGATALGYPYTAFGTWTIDTADSTGVFGTLQGLSGTDTLYYAGLHAAGSYSGTLG